MEKFSINHLPHLLQTGIFEYLLPEELLKCLQVNRRFRHFVLCNGPFQRRLNRMDICATEADDQLSGDELLVHQLSISLGTDDANQYRFLSTTKPFLRTFNDVGETITIRPTDTRLFRQLRFCRGLNVEVLEPIHTNHSRRAKEHGYQLISFLPPFKNRHLESLYLGTSNNRQGAVILGAVEARIVSDFCYEHNLPVSQSEPERMEVPNSPAFRDFFHHNLAECSKIHVENCRLERLFILPDPHLDTKSKAVKINVQSRYGDDFVRSYKSLLKFGIPSQISGARLKLIIYLNEEAEVDLADSLLDGLLEDLYKVAEQVEDRISCQEILKTFETSSPSLDLLLNNNELNLIAAYFFRRRLSENSYCFYVVLCIDASVYLYVQAAQIS